MSEGTALARYLQKYIEPDLPDCPANTNHWQQVLVIPAYREAPSVLQRLKLLRSHNGRILVILVLNRPDNDGDSCANSDLRTAVAELPQGTAKGIKALNTQCDLYLLDIETSKGPNPTDQGVGLARKAGCDLAVKWIAQGAIDNQWIHSSDADAHLSVDYFERLRDTAAVAATFPFWHTPGGEPICDRATALYELRLHYYVLGLEYAASPYAWHTLGSCLAVQADAYVKVRGFPKRAGGEDFYLLNKLGKLGSVARLDGQCIGLESRASKRVPFGTGPAVEKIIAAAQPALLPLFYHPACFRALKEILICMPHWYQQGERLQPHDSPQRNNSPLQEQLLAAGLEDTLAEQSGEQLLAMGLSAALTHCQRQSKSAPQFARQFHQWFDGFRTLKFIHGLRSRGWTDQSLADLQRLQPEFWPQVANQTDDAGVLRRGLLQHFGWQLPDKASQFP